MPFQSDKQARLMRAVAHGWNPDRAEGPTRAVASKFVREDQRNPSGFAYGGVAYAPRNKPMPMMGRPQPTGFSPPSGRGALSQGVPRHAPRQVGPVHGRGMMPPGRGPLSAVARSAPPKIAPGRRSPLLDGRSNPRLPHQGGIGAGRARGALGLGRRY